MHLNYVKIFGLKRHLKTGAGDKSISDEIVVEAVKPNHIDLSVNLLETCDDCAKNVSPILKLTIFHFQNKNSFFSRIASIVAAGEIHLNVAFVNVIWELMKIQI